MRNLFNGVVNWIAALFAANGGAPHPIVATDTANPARKSRKPKRRRR
ncbi:hypothetical protein [Agrococcus citreus]|uniref:Uncharacterized protein n=1 Tax=Agrococcus citreus TaxID=84643 RepID=A0ABN1YY85_9MICO